jgi:phosphoglycolate phosphatase
MGARAGPVVGFDLDMTLVDSAAGIADTLAAALAEQDLPMDRQACWPLIGLPLEDTLLALAPRVDLAAAVAAYRAGYPLIGAPAATLLPGAVDSIAAVHVRGGRVLVVSAKIESAVRAVLRHVGLEHGEAAVDEVVGGLFGPAKASALLLAGAAIFVGDHPGDVAAARLAGACPVAVSTGPHGRAELTRAGAQVVLSDLREFPSWLDRWLALAASG